jgi:hypothetical protein
MYGAENELKQNFGDRKESTATIWKGDRERERNS